MTDAKPKKYSYFIGIDISRNELDYAVMHGKSLLFHREAKNDPIDILLFIDELKLLPKFTITRSVFCMEDTGIYCNHLYNVLRKIKANIVSDHALQIKNSLGLIRGKNDKVDSLRIAQYAYTNRDFLKLKIFKRPILIQLANLLTMRNRLLCMETGLKIPLAEQIGFVKKGVQTESAKACKRSLDALKLDVKETDREMDSLIKSDERLTRIFEIITSVPNVGRITAIQMIISTNEFKDFKDPKKFACYAGVAPFLQESGVKKGKARVSHIANKKMKALLHICAINSIRNGSELKGYYLRKVAEGKPKMAVLNAIRNKIIVRIFTCINQDRLYSLTYTKNEELQQA